MWTGYGRNEFAHQNVYFDPRHHRLKTQSQLESLQFDLLWRNFWRLMNHSIYSKDILADADLNLEYTTRWIGELCVDEDDKTRPILRLLLFPWLFCKHKSSLNVFESSYSFKKEQRRDLRLENLPLAQVEFINVCWCRPMSTAIPRWKYRFSSDHRSQATSGVVST